jgi:hypothetical protein
MAQMCVLNDTKNPESQRILPLLFHKGCQDRHGKNAPSSDLTHIHILPDPPLYFRKFSFIAISYHILSTKKKARRITAAPAFELA